MSDERGEWPSASSMEQIALCPGSFMAQRDLDDVSGPEAERGTRIHAWLEGEDIQLTDEELDCAKNLEAKRDDLVARVFPKGKTNVIKEVRLWLNK